MLPENLQAGLFNPVVAASTYATQPSVHQLPPNYRTAVGTPVRGAIRIDDEVFDAYKNAHNYTEQYSDIIDFAAGNDDRWPSSHIAGNEIADTGRFKSYLSRGLANKLLDRLSNDVVAYGATGGIGDWLTSGIVGQYSRSFNQEDPDTIWIDFKDLDEEESRSTFHHETLHGLPQLDHTDESKLTQDAFRAYEKHLDYGMPSKDKDILQEALNNARIFPPRGN